jgi:adenylosuccinate synthase
MKIIGVVGAAFGDEGKGRMIHHFASQSKSPCIVVRYNGGAQAGHTVVTDDGRSHIFHHFGSGTLDGADTYLSEFFLVNPILWQAENEDLLTKVKQTPKVFVHPSAPLTTPYDMLINRELERRRKKKHGSCGYGIAETVQRMCASHCQLSVQDIRTRSFFDRVKELRKEWIPLRLSQLKIKDPSDNFVKACASDALLNDFMVNSVKFVQSTTPLLNIELTKWETILFEGAQGLCLDESSRFFPHVTRSRTGCDNIMEICGDIDCNDIEIVYVTRAYTTRHGEGPFPTEGNDLTYTDMSNVKNEWQGSMRFGCLDLDTIQEFVRKDKKSIDVKCKRSVAITCMDQVGPVVDIQYKKQRKKIRIENLPKVVANALGAKQVYLSWKM